MKCGGVESRFLCVLIFFVPTPTRLYCHLLAFFFILGSLCKTKVWIDRRGEILRKVCVDKAEGSRWK